MKKYIVIAATTLFFLIPSLSAFALTVAPATSTAPATFTYTTSITNGGYVYLNSGSLPICVQGSAISTGGGNAFSAWNCGFTSTSTVGTYQFMQQTSGSSCSGSSYATCVGSLGGNTGGEVDVQIVSGGGSATTTDADVEGMSVTMTYLLLLPASLIIFILVMGHLLKPKND